MVYRSASFTMMFFVLTLCPMGRVSAETRGLRIPYFDESGFGFVDPEYRAGQGYVAWRDITDPQGKITKREYFRAKAGIDQKLTHYSEPEMEKVGEEVNTFDKAGRVIRRDRYDRNMKLLWYFIETYDQNGEETSSIEYDGIHKKIHGNFNWDSANYGHPWDFYQIWYADDGKTIVSVSGVIPEDVRAQLPWGETVEGVACCIAPEKTTGQFVDMRFILMVATDRYEPEAERQPSTTGYVSATIVDEHSDVIPMDVNPENSQDTYLSNLEFPGKPPEGSKRIAVDVGGRRLALKSWYGHLLPGKYKLTVAVHPTGSKTRIVSNTIEVTVEPPAKNSETTAPVR